MQTYQSSQIGQGIGGGGGGAAERNAFMATGGTILDPGDGYIYHRLPTSNTGLTANVFEVVQLNSDPTRNEIKVMLGGAGGGGGGGGSSDSSSGTPGAGGSGGAVGAWTVPVTVGTYDQSRGVGGTSPFGPNGQGQSGPGGGGSGNPGGSSFFRASGDPSRQLTTPGGRGGNPGGGPGNPASPTPGSNVAISWTWSGGTLDDDSHLLLSLVTHQMVDLQVCPQPSDKCGNQLVVMVVVLVVMVVVDPTPTTKVDGETLVTPQVVLLHS